jgi:hypothetical protein
MSRPARLRFLTLLFVTAFFAKSALPTAPRAMSSFLTLFLPGSATAMPPSVASSVTNATAIAGARFRQSRTAASGGLRRQRLLTRKRRLYRRCFESLPVIEPRAR